MSEVVRGVCFGLCGTFSLCISHLRLRGKNQGVGRGGEGLWFFFCIEMGSN